MYMAIMYSLQVDSDLKHFLEIEKLSEIKLPLVAELVHTAFANNPIYPFLSTWIRTWTEPEALYE